MMKSIFKMPNAVKITGRTSSITNSFVNGIVPGIMPSVSEVKEVLAILDMDGNSVRCAYCSDMNTEWDHFTPLIRDKRQTGYITEIHNLVPSCGKCNQSKGNYYWREWILGTAKLSPKTRKVVDLDLIILRLDKYEAWRKPTVVDFEEIVGKDIWEQHWSNCDKLHVMMRESQKLSDDIKLTIATELARNSNPEPAKSRLLTKDLIDENVRKVGLIVQTRMKVILESNQISIEEINLLQTETYSKETFDLQYPLLKRVDLSKTLIEQMQDHKGRNRYYKSTIKVHGESYLLCSQWYERDRPSLLQWIAIHSSHPNGIND